MNDQIENKWLEELKEIAEPEWLDLLTKPQGASILIARLPVALPAEKVAELGTRERRIWELIGLYYRANGLFYDSIAIYSSMYHHFLKLQNVSGNRVHKGMPLLWIAESYYYLGFSTLSKRYLMITLMEDAITGKGKIDPSGTGVYFRLAWWHGLTDTEINTYAEEAYQNAKNHAESMYPEWVLQEVDQDWNIEIPGANEATYYKSNELYVKFLLEQLGEPTGKILERLAEYLLVCMPGCRTSRRERSNSTDYDVVCSLQGPDIDFRSELGRYFVVECKDWGKPVNFSAFAKFCRVLDSVKSRFGIIFSNEGITGEGKNSDAEREQQKVFQDRGMVIIVVNKEDIDYLADDGNLISILKKKYEKVRLDLKSIGT